MSAEWFLRGVGGDEALNLNGEPLDPAAIQSTLCGEVLHQNKGLAKNAVVTQNVTKMAEHNFEGDINSEEKRFRDRSLQSVAIYAPSFVYKSTLCSSMSWILMLHAEPAAGPRSSALNTGDRAASTHAWARNVSPLTLNSTSAISPICRCRLDGGTVMLFTFSERESLVTVRSQLIVMYSTLENRIRLKDDCSSVFLTNLMMLRSVPALTKMTLLVVVVVPTKCREADT
uniref:Uncharacterized protein n=1 Tax=Leersia perrieri TaxID=77586 RepID=A0A0D9W9S6_9ORYZ